MSDFRFKTKKTAEVEEVITKVLMFRVTTGKESD
jgi:hypothetical protein